MSLKLCLDTTAEVQRGAEGGWRSAQVDWMLLGWVEGVTPGLIVLMQGTAGCWCRHTCCPCQERGLKLSSLILDGGIPAKASRGGGCKPSEDGAGKSESILKYQVPEFNFLGALDGLSYSSF